MGKEHIDAVSCSTFRADCAHRHLCDASHAHNGCLWQCLATQPRSIPRQGGKGPGSWVLSLLAGECAPSEQPHEADSAVRQPDSWAGSRRVQAALQQGWGETSSGPPCWVAPAMAWGGRHRWWELQLHIVLWVSKHPTVLPLPLHCSLYCLSLPRNCSSLLLSRMAAKYF